MTQSENEQNDTPIVLSLDEVAFVTAYFKNNMNGTRAYMSLHPNATYDSARALASKTLSNVNILNEIKRIQTENLMTEEEALWRIGAIAKADLFPFIRTGKDGFVYFDLSDSQAMEYLFLVKEMETKRERHIEVQGKSTEEWEGEWVRIKLHDAYAALRDIAKMHGKLADRHELIGAGGKDLPAPIVQIYIPKNDRDDSNT